MQRHHRFIDEDSAAFEQTINTGFNEKCLSLAFRLDRLIEHLRYAYRVKIERLTLEKLSDEQLRDIAIHRADADFESSRRYFDLPAERD